MFEPYAAKAIIEHQWAAGSLSVWLTFHFPMNQKIKPANTVWLVKVDGTVKTVSSSAWQDAFTMLLTISSITTAPALVFVSFAGPNSNLETTWKKNWEPWGYIPSTDKTATYLPAGIIVCWKGTIATIPTGWALCNGSNGTPDLRDKFVVCAKEDNGGQAKTYIDGTWTKSGGTIIHNHYGDTGAVNYGSDFDAISEINDNWHIPPYYALAYIMKL